MMVRRLKGEMTKKEAPSLAKDTLSRIARADEEFSRACVGFAQSIGHTADLKLGWGIARGAVQRLDEPEDYVGPNVNKCARLCALGRPFGVVIDYDDFPDLPQVRGFKFFEQHRHLTGIEAPVRVWVTEHIASLFLTRESLRQQPEVHVAGHCINAEDKKRLRILIARRSPTRRLHPGKWEGCGGQLAANETFADGVQRHFRMEMNLEVKVLEDVHCFYVIREPSIPIIPGIRFLCELLSSPEAARSHNHTELRWVTEAELKNLPGDQFIPELREQVIGLLARYKAGVR